jgi:hypothetical protein
MISTGFQWMYQAACSFANSSFARAGFDPERLRGVMPSAVLSFTLTLYSWERLAPEVIPRRTEMS